MHFVQWIYIYAKCLFCVCALANGELCGIWATQREISKYSGSTSTNTRTHTLESDCTHLVNTNTAPCTWHKCFQFQFIWLSVLVRCCSIVQMEYLNEWQRQGMWNGIECVYDVRECQLHSYCVYHSISAGVHTALTIKLCNETDSNKPKHL